MGRLVEEILNSVLGPKINAARAALIEVGNKTSITEIKKGPLLTKDIRDIDSSSRRSSKRNLAKAHLETMYRETFLADDRATSGDRCFARWGKAGN